MNDAVADGVGKDRIADLFPPAGDVKLRTEYRRRLFVSRLRNFEKISRFGLLERVKQPFVQYEQRRFLVLLYYPGIRSVPAGYGKLGEQLRKPDVSYLKKTARRRHAERTSDIRLARAYCTEQNDVVPFRDEIAGRQSRYLRLIQITVVVILDIFNTVADIGKLCLLDEAFQMIVLAGCPFLIYQQSETVFKRHFRNTRISQLILEGF